MLICWRMFRVDVTHDQDVLFQATHELVRALVVFGGESEQLTDPLNRKWCTSERVE